MTERTPVPARLTARALMLSLSLVVAFAGGCPKFGTLPARELYRLSLPDTVGEPLPAGTDGGGSPLIGTLGIAQYATPGIYGDPLIVYRINETEYNSYPTREWAVPLSDQLGVLTERVLARVPLTAERAVFDPPSRRAQTYIWRATVREFEEVDSGSEVRAAVRIDARVVRAEDDSIVWSGSSRFERPAANPSMSGIVQTLSALADEVVTDLAMRARKEIAARRP